MYVLSLFHFSLKLKMFTHIVSAQPNWACNSCGNVIPCHISRACIKEEIYPRCSNYGWLCWPHHQFTVLNGRRPLFSSHRPLPLLIFSIFMFNRKNLYTKSYKDLSFSALVHPKLSLNSSAGSWSNRKVYTTMHACQSIINYMYRYSWMKGGLKLYLWDSCCMSCDVTWVLAWAQE